MGEWQIWACCTTASTALCCKGYVPCRPRPAAQQHLAGTAAEAARPAALLAVLHFWPCSVSHATEEALCFEGMSNTGLTCTMMV